MGKIIKIKGNTVRESEFGVLLHADEQCIFGIDDLFDETNKGDLTWTLKDDKGGKVSGFPKKGKWDAKLFLTINKKLCGDYRYQLGASFNSKSKKTTYTTISVGGYCEPKITNAQINLPKKVGCEMIKGQISIEAEGLNGNTLDCELDFHDSCKYVSKKCVEGVAVFDISINTTSFLTELTKEDKKETEQQLKIRILDKAGNSIKDNGGQDIVINEKITISTTQKVSPKSPKNNTISSINKADKIKMEVNGIIELEKIEFKTSYNVCNDEYRGSYDLWLLDGNCHWLKKRENDVDKKKPDPLPITLPSDDAIKLKATFKTIIDIDNIKIKIKDKSGKYLFAEKTQGTQSSGTKFSLDFTSNLPTIGIDYNENFELIFEYSFDGTVWIPLCFAKFCLYLTLEEPSYVNSLPNTSYINETLLWLTCKAAKGLSDKDGIVDAIFSELKSLKVTRRREGNDKYLSTNLKNKGLGYWRGNSSLNTDFALTGRIGTIKLLLGEYGEARCGEWADFFIYLCNTQSISNVEELLFYAKGMYQIYHPIADLTAAGVNTSQSPHDDSGTKALIMITPTDNFDHAIKYDEEIPSAFLVKSPANSWQLMDGKPPKQLNAKAQGNSNPLHMFWDHVFAVRAGRFYDPSYGVAGANNHGSHTQLMKEYAQNCLAGVPMIAIPNPASGVKGEKYKDKHTGKYVNFAIGYAFEDNKNKVPGFTYKYITMNIDDKLYFT